ncbi:MAG: DUF4919 domain-containing protein [Firmicutes bacterium]|nr:DUF4919 domain-containing protein [Bacillota bacterium]
MKKVFVLIAILCLCVSAVLSSPAFAQADNPDKIYEAMLDKAKKGDQNLDFTEMRMAFAKTSFYDPYNTNRITKDMWDLFKAKKFREAADKANIVLSSNYLDVDAHFICFISYKQLGDTANSKHHYLIFRGILNSIMKSGDGTTPATAFKVISVPEEYSLLNALGMKLVKQSLIEQNGKRFDKMEVTHSQSGDSRTIYFNIDIPFSWLEKKMSGKGK